MSARADLVAQPTQSSYRWLMLGLVCLLYFSFGLVSASLAPLLTNIQDDLQVSDALLGAALAAWQFVYIFFAIPAGAAVERLGPRKALAIAGFLIALSQFWRAAALNYPAFVLGIAVFGLGGPLVSIGAPATVARWFSARERAVATGLYSVSSASGTVVALFTANTVLMPLTGDSWRLTLAAYGFVALVAAVAWVLMAREADFGQSEPGQANVRTLSRFREVARIPPVRIMLVMSIGIFMFSQAPRTGCPLCYTGRASRHPRRVCCPPCLPSSASLRRWRRRATSLEVWGGSSECWRRSLLPGRWRRSWCQ